MTANDLINSHGVGVTLDSLERQFGPTRALDHFSLHMNPGEMIVLLGPSGCGKTTALRALAGLETVDSGRIFIGDQDVTHIKAAKRDTAMVFQQYSLFPHMSVVDNVAFGLRVRGVSKKERNARAMENLELVGLSDQAEKFVHQMSGGQQQRVALARALTVRPRVLLLDEPLSALDAKVRVNLRDEIRRIQLATGTTTLFVTHDQEEALAVADRIGVMNKGKLAQIGSPEEIYNRPADEFVASFIGLTNRIPAHCQGDRALIGQHTVPLLRPMHGEGEVLVRPEHITLEPVTQGKAQGGQPYVTGMSFLGAEARVRVDMGGHDVIARLSPNQAAQIRVGDSVEVGFRAVHALGVTSNAARASSPGPSCSSSLSSVSLPGDAMSTYEVTGEDARADA
ncbi:ABC transporter ATP-binding protein [Actinomyces vulturis]|uniref:ABC transporter ATP-binding protein n=1 Tax=Actinomyces vulturis TaxID=1857645 RepID=UPI00082A9ED9|nr:ABC transporter ATP-binding protein [Actinomyces vulturis]